MKKAILAIDPKAVEKSWFPQLSRIMRSLQKKGEVEEVLVLSIINHDAFLLPYAYYEKIKFQLQGEIHRDIRNGVASSFSVADIRVPISSSSHADDVAKAITRYANDMGADSIILVNESRSALSKLFGSVTDEVKQISDHDVLVINPTLAPKEDFAVATERSWDRGRFSVSPALAQ